MGLLFNFIGGLVCVLILVVSILLPFTPFDLNVFFKNMKFSLYDHEVELVQQYYEEQISDPLMVNNFSTIIFGFNANLDVVVSALYLMRVLNLSMPFEHEIKDHHLLTNVSDLSGTMAYFMRDGRAAERTMKSASQFEKLIAATKQLEDAQYFVGGNAALMAQNIAFWANMTNSTRNSKYPQLWLLAPVGPHLAKLLHPTLQIPDECYRATDEEHLILEYPNGAKWGANTQQVAPQANRFIVTYDVTNAHLFGMELISKVVFRTKAQLLVVGGLHAAENLAEEEWHRRLDILIDQLQNLTVASSSKVVVHLELASMTNSSRMKELLFKIFPLVDSLGLNEQELAFLAAAGNGPWKDNIFSDDEALPSPDRVIDTLTWLLRHHGSRLSRVHLHTLGYHVTALAANSHWLNQRSASMAAARVSGQLACGSLRPSSTQLRLQFPRRLRRHTDDASWQMWRAEEPLWQWTDATNDMQFYFAPVLVCRRPLRTVGLGDAISSTGLIYSGFDYDK